MLFGYFDESGTDGQHGHTVIAGFFGELAEWVRFSTAWEQALIDENVAEFHYSGCVNREKCYAGWDHKSQIAPHLSKMAQIICDHNLNPFAIAHRGDFKSVSARFPNSQNRYSSAYSVCFELLMGTVTEKVNFRQMSPPVMVIAKHPEYSKHCGNVFDLIKETGNWSGVTSIVHSSPSQVVALQAADMIAYEARRYVWKLSKLRDPEHWNEMPLLSRIMPLVARGERFADSIMIDDTKLEKVLAEVSPSSD